MLALGWGPLFLSRRTRLGFHTAWWAPKERVPKMSQKEDLASEVTPLTLATFHLLKQHKVLPRFKATVSTSLWGSARFWKHVGQEILLWSFWENKNCHSITWQHVRPAASQVIPRPTESEPAFNESKGLPLHMEKHCSKSQMWHCFEQEGTLVKFRKLPLAAV